MLPRNYVFNHLGILFGVTSMRMPMPMSRNDIRGSHIGTSHEWRIPILFMNMKFNCGSAPAGLAIKSFFIGINGLGTFDAASFGKLNAEMLDGAQILFEGLMIEPNM